MSFEPKPKPAPPTDREALRKARYFDDIADFARVVLKARTELRVVPHPNEDRADIYLSRSFTSRSGAELETTIRLSSVQISDHLAGPESKAQRTLAELDIAVAAGLQSTATACHHDSDPLWCNKCAEERTR
jgi:hypothetical protein